MSSTDTPEKADAFLAERVCRVTLDLKVRVTEVTSEMLRSSLFWDETDQAGSLALAERQNCLLHALLRNKDALHQFISYVAINDLRLRLDADMIVNADVQDEDEVLKSVLSRLSLEEAGHIYDGTSDAPIGEEIELFHQCFSLNWNESVLAEIEVILPSKQRK
jgi:hypothetical protein